MTGRDRPAQLSERLVAYHAELTRHAARMLGSHFEAEDAVQETMIRAWTALDRFEGRAQLRTWLYRICTNVCLDMLASRQRRARRGLDASDWEIAASERGPSATGDTSAGDPADVVETRESVRFALETILQRLPPKQRAVLMLREVLHCSAAEIADLLGTSVASVNSALQRGRMTLRRTGAARGPMRDASVEDLTRLRLNRYVRALESSDVTALTALLVHEAA